MTVPNHAKKPASEGEVWSVARVLKWAADDLARRGIESPRLDAELLLGKVLSLDRVQLILQHERPLSEEELRAFKQLFVRRRKGEPIAYILGSREFFGFEVRVDPRVLIPRPDSETLVEVALDRTRGRDMYGHALDLCTGSGCIALALGRERKTWKVIGTDVSEPALTLAHLNAQRLGLAHNVHFALGDLFEAVPADLRFDLIVSNPPYIPDGEIETLMVDVKDFEPRLALTGGPDGYQVLRRLIQDAPQHLAAGGVLACEVGAGQSDRVAELFERAGFVAVRRNRDYAGHERVVSGKLGQ